MISRAIKRGFSSYQRNNHMKLTIRTPYKTLLNECEDFVRIKSNVQGRILSLQNRSPSGLYIILPGLLEIRLTKEVPGFSGNVIHNGGFIAVHLDNSCEISLMDAFERDTLNPDQLSNWEMPEFENTETQRFVKQIREKSTKVFANKMI